MVEGNLAAPNVPVVKLLALLIAGPLMVNSVPLKLNDILVPSLNTNLPPLLPISPVPWLAPPEFLCCIPPT